MCKLFEKLKPEGKLGPKRQMQKEVINHMTIVQ